MLLPQILPVLHPTVHRTHGGDPAVRSSRVQPGPPRRVVCAVGWRPGAALRKLRPIQLIRATSTTLSDRGEDARAGRVRPGIARAISGSRAEDAEDAERRAFATSRCARPEVERSTTTNGALSTAACICGSLHLREAGRGERTIPCRSPRAQRSPREILVISAQNPPVLQAGATVTHRPRLSDVTK